MNRLHIKPGFFDINCPKQLGPRTPLKRHGFMDEFRLLCAPATNQYLPPPPHNNNMYNNLDNIYNEMYNSYDYYYYYYYYYLLIQTYLLRTKKFMKICVT